MTLQLEHSILLVDDEPSITRSLHRLFRKDRYRVMTAMSGQEGLDILTGLDRPLSLIISDQRMPGMTGAQFLEKARVLAPEAIRFLLTGYSDVKDILDAVNKGEIHRYLTKPWNDDELLLHVRGALETYELTVENRRLNELTLRQNAELTGLNQELERKVRERTIEILEKSQALEKANASLERGFLDTIRLLSSLVETLNPNLGSYLSYVSQLARQMGAGLGLDKRRLEEIEIAGLLHDIGLLGLPKTVIQKESEEMGDAELKLFMQHPIIGQICLQPVERLDAVGAMVYAHHENYDGSGFPEGIKGEAIPLGARIIRLAADYTANVRKWPKNTDAIRQRAAKFIGHAVHKIADEDPQILIREIIKQIFYRQSRRLYDPEMVHKLFQILEENEKKTQKAAQKPVAISLWFLKPGMKLAQELRVRDGRLLLARGSLLTAAMITAIQKLSKSVLMDERLEIEAD